MSTVIRHILSGILFSFLLTIAILTLVFHLFPPESYAVLWEKEIGNVAFIIWLLGFVLAGGTIFGISTGWYWKQRLYRIERKLDKLSKGQRIDDEKEPYHELKSIEKRLELIQTRIDQQTEFAQKIATERAEEREKSLQEIVVQERNRLARELHDSVSQQLFAASMMMAAINLHDLPGDHEIKKKMQLVEKMLQQSQLEMRALLLHLRPVALKGKSLVEGIEELLREMKQKVSMDITWTVEELSVDKGIEDQLFRIMQEAMSNTLRHAMATSFHVLLIKREDTVILRISDDGIGFDMERMKTGSYGMQNMRERAYEIGGTFKVVSLPNQGTKLEVKVPIPTETKGRKVND
ncbi:sensor histidine kinase [Oceanobacillus luteolus]|uniref:sensor histidine kinase n=1 Tax=Oceanobacillus luteolus TaxID=1274358 RepID=UPI00203F9275|nr:sensor histidine kinase [Oceanobacillus luteolus]MCM3739296.1 sensor histidine kinase [Oceanobacillus luteolus]